MAQFVLNVWGNNSSVAITLQGVATNLKSGSFTLGPNMSASITYSGFPVPDVFIVGM